MDSRIVLSTFSPSVTTFLSLLEDPCRESTPADVFDSLKAAFIQPVYPQASTHRLLQAADLQQLQRAILLARSQRRRLKAVTDPSATRAKAALASGAYVVDVSALTRHSKNRNMLTAQCGALLSHMFAAYEMRTQAPLGSVRSVGGAIATGLLGGCASDSLVADCCVQISLIDSFGRLRVYSASQGGPMFNAIRLSLGAFGVIYDVSFCLDKLRRYVKVRTSFHLHRSLFTRGAASLQRRLRDAVGVEVVWSPFNSYNARKRWRAEDDLVWLRVLKHAHSMKSEQLDVCYAVPTVAQWLSRHARPLAKGGYGGFHERHTPAFQRAAFVDTAWKLDGHRVTTSVHHAVHHMQMEHGAMSEVSVCVPLRREAEWQALSRAWFDAVGIVESKAALSEYPLNGGLKVRFVKGSSALLAANRGKCCAVLSASSARGTRGWAAFAGEVTARWMAVAGARWVFSRDSAWLVEKEALRKGFGDELRLFRALYESSADDYGMFVDDVLGDVLQLGRFDGGAVGHWVGKRDAGRALKRWHRLDEIGGVEDGAGRAGGRNFGDDVDDGGTRLASSVGTKGDGGRLVRRRSSRRGQRKAAAASREWRFLLAYVAAYVVLWLALFARDGYSALLQYIAVADSSNIPH
eukprot:gb/GEZJ01001631.1/.p1 GENE.gb/GEZJ01001631.1/~~gb/GEZJ01001631.1/.p1  ORF type:complete len:634 (-),score=59.90 gb/GEZJ01001631.1/:173-2074(-)